MRLSRDSQFRVQSILLLDGDYMKFNGVIKRNSATGLYGKGLNDSMDQLELVSKGLDSATSKCNGLLSVRGIGKV